MKYHTIKIKPRVDGHPLTSFNAEVLLDGVPLKCVKSIKFDMDAGRRRVGYMRIELFGDLELEGVDYSCKKQSAVGDSHEGREVDTKDWLNIGDEKNDR